MSDRTMYMHTLDGRPAIYCDRHESPGIFFAEYRTPTTLVSSLRQIRREQQNAIREDWRYWLAMKPEYRGERPSIKRYGYVLVKVAP